MLFVFISICCSVCVSVLLKLARRYEVNLFQAVMWNYATAAMLCLFFFRPVLAELSWSGRPWVLYGALAILLPALFIILGLSVRSTGIVRTDLAQRLSLFIPLATAFVVFNESYSLVKLGGIALGFIAICFSIPWAKSRGSGGQGIWYYPVIVFLGAGTIDILFKQLAAHGEVPYTESLFVVFVIAFLLCLCYFPFAVGSKSIKRFSRFNLIAGVILGIFNFGNILFYLKAHQALPQSPALVFSSMNIGVIVFGAVVGLAFGEKLSLLNKLGLVLAVIAIFIITYAS